jgi:hypothetical protein
MSFRQPLYNRYNNLVSSPKKRSRIQPHEVSDSEWDERESDDGESGADYYRDPSSFLNKFSGYESDADDDVQFREDDDEEGSFDNEEEDESVSEEEEAPARAVKQKPFKIPKIKKVSEGFDFMSLPVINNNGLKYLPTMRYFPIGEVCPLKAQNKVQ